MKVHLTQSLDRFKNKGISQVSLGQFVTCALIVLHVCNERERLLVFLFTFFCISYLYISISVLYYYCLNDNVWPIDILTNCVNDTLQKCHACLLFSIYVGLK